MTPLYFAVKISAENGMLPSGNEESFRTAEYVVRADCEATAIAQVTQWILVVLHGTGAKLLRYIDVAARCLPNQNLNPVTFQEKGLENFDPYQWLHFIRQEGPQYLRAPDGSINNCALAHGDEEATCQICHGNCPDKGKYKWEG